MQPLERDMDDLGRKLLDVGWSAPDFETWQRFVFDVLHGVGYDVAFLKPMPPNCAFGSRGFDATILSRARARWADYESELLPLLRASQRYGVAIDNEVLGPERKRLAYYRDVVAPHRGTSSLFAYLSVGGREVGAILLGRAGGAFSAKDADRVRGLLAPLSLGLAAQARNQRSPFVATTSSAPCISRRESEVLRLVQLGYTNPEIARALGSSPNTVRNQVSSLLHKLDATTRAELVGLTMRQ